MTNHATSYFWSLYESLSPQVQRRADKNLKLFQQDPNHPSLHFKRVGRFWSARVGASYRALAVDSDDGLLWVWIGSHDEYERMIKKRP